MSNLNIISTFSSLYKWWLLPSLVAIFCFSGSVLDAQIISIEKTIKSAQIVDDSLTILPSSVILIINDNIVLSKENYTIYNNTISLPDWVYDKYKGEHLSGSYRTFSFNLSKTYFHLDSTVVDTINHHIFIGYEKPKSGRKIIDANNLDYNGTFSRGFSVGNAQSLNLNSNFDLQLSGDLGHGITVAAAISDDNIPIQPEGNTQLLQEFDRVFIKVSKDKTSILAGDFQLKKPRGYFTRYQKKLKGLSVETTINAGKTSINTDASVAVARGKFSRQSLPTSEGNQGPYKLRGNDGERFLIVLSGTERVYLDDRLLKRGFNYDYTIDYNRAEVVFSPNILIRNESRIIVEFEYTDQNYLRTLYSSNTYFNGKKWTANLNVYNEQDSKTATGDIVLDSTDITQLVLSGDNFAFKDGVYSIADTSRIARLITYTRVLNTNPEDTATFILVYSDDPTLDLVQASFTEVEIGQGTYNIDDQSTASGRVYKYVGPGEGVYVPLIKLTPPEKRQMVSLGGSYQILQEGTISGELSFSNFDKNRFSIIQNDDNKGLAGILRYDQNIKLDSLWSLQTNMQYEVTEKSFTPINPYRNPEFSRDWNLSSTKTTNNQELINANVSLKKNKSFDLTYGLHNYKIGDQFKGLKHRLESHANFSSGTAISVNSSILDSKNEYETTRFKRLKAQIEQTFSKVQGLTIGISSDIENNKRNPLSDPNLLLSNSKGYERHDMYIKNKSSSKYHFKFGYSQRTDRTSDSTRLAPTINTRELSLSSKISFSPTHNLKIVTTHRDFQVVQDGPLVNELNDKKTLVGKIDYNLNLLRFLIFNTSYTIQGGQQPKVEYSYQRVPAGQGDYTYEGNPDSTLVNLDFRYDHMNTGKANYIRIALVNGEFVSTTNQLISQSLRLSPKRLWRKNQTKLPKWKKLVSRLSTISTIRIDKRALAENGVQYLNFRRDSMGLVQYTGLIVNTLFINKGQKAFDSQISYRNSSNIITQIAGLETRTNDNYTLNTRIGIGRHTDFLLESIIGNRRYSSQSFSDRDFDIKYYNISPKLSLRPGDKFRIVLDYSFNHRNEILNPDQLIATSNEFAIDFNFSNPTKLSFQSRFSLINVDFDADTNSALEFDILQGLKDGRNYIWSSRLTKRLSTNLDISFSYEGRKTGNIPIVHIARAQVKATF